MAGADSSVKLLPQESRIDSRLDYPWESYGARTLSDQVHHVWDKQKKRIIKKKEGFTWLDWLSHFLPCIGWLRTYNWKEWLICDIIAGISVGFMVVPQGMSYANSANLPAVFGMYGAFLPCLVYGLVGSSRQLAVGPVAVTSLLIGSSLPDLVPCYNELGITSPNNPKPEQMECQEQYNRTAIQLSLVVSVLYTLVGLLRLGWVTKFLSHAVIGGFISGASIIISLGQFKYIVGIYIKPPKDRLNLIIGDYVKYAHDFKWQEFIMGMVLLGLLLIMKELGKKYRAFKWVRPLGPLTACIIGLCSVYIGNVDEENIRIVGDIPSGLPAPTWGWWTQSWPEFGQLLLLAVIVMLVDLLESTSIARALARKNGYELVYNREIVGLGLANFAGACFNAYTTTGSFSRSAVNNDSGAKSPLSQFVCAIVVGFVLLFLTPVFSHLPYNVLGAIIVSSVLSLFEYELAIYLFRVNKLDFLVFCASFLGTLFASVEIGLGIAIGLHVLIALFETAFPHSAVLGRIPGANVFRNIKQYPNAEQFPGVLIFRIDAPIYFANVKYLEDRLDKLRSRYTQWSKEQGCSSLYYLVIDMTPVGSLDAMALHFLEELVLSNYQQGTQVLLCNPSVPVMREMHKVALGDLVGRENIFVSTSDAVTYSLQQLNERGLLGKVPANPPSDKSHSVDGVATTAGSSSN